MPVLVLAQQASVPSVRSPQLLSVPALTARNVPGGATLASGAWMYLSQQVTVASVRTAHAWLPPRLTDVKVPAGTGTGTWARAPGAVARNATPAATTIARRRRAKRSVILTAVSYNARSAGQGSPIGRPRDRPYPLALYASAGFG